MDTEQREPHWPAALALLVCVGLYIVLPNRLVFGPRWILPVLISLPLAPLMLKRHRHPDESPWVRQLTIALIALITVANMVSVALLVHELLRSNVLQGRNLIYSALSIWLTNVIVYGLWFWELDRGGPHLRAGGKTRFADLQFPQMENPSLAPSNWRPRFFDYLYTSLANGASFAPADAMPLSRQAKALFASEAMVSLVTVVVVGARAVNILK